VLTLHADVAPVHDAVGAVASCSNEGVPTICRDRVEDGIDGVGLFFIGVDVLLVEKNSLIGGTTARSAGSLWVPNSRHAQERDDTALAYLWAALGNRIREDMVSAFLRASQRREPPR
jgi:FAD binding domain